MTRILVRCPCPLSERRGCTKHLSATARTREVNPTMSQQELQKNKVIHRLVFELRYDYGYEYLDRCGRTINLIQEECPDWAVADVGVQGTVLVQPQTEAKFAFAPLKLDFSQELSKETTVLLPIEEFAQTASNLTEKVVKVLELDQFSRIGFRAWILFGMPSFEGAKDAIRDTQIVRPACIDAIGDKGDLGEVGFSLVLSRDECLTRVAVAAVRQRLKVSGSTIEAARRKPYRHPPEKRQELLREKIQANKAIKHFPEYAVLVDIDHSLDDPPYPQLDISDFILSNYRWSNDNAHVFVEPRRGGQSS